jgi:two-component system chemotaxis response regulator CheB
MDDDPINRHRPSVAALFASVLEAAPRACVAALLTGMGADGAKELCEMHAAGVHTIAQDEATSVVWGMPGEAVKAGGASEVLPLPQIGFAILRALGHRAAS